MPEPKHACADCAHYNRRRVSESWELDHIFWYEHDCFARLGISNLKQFPFYNTTCPSFTWSLSHD